MAVYLMQKKKPGSEWGPSFSSVKWIKKVGQEVKSVATKYAQCNMHLFELLMISFRHV